jgi:teichuronic acid biosynthesis glycosyltransferase TuaC
MKVVFVSSGNNKYGVSPIIKAQGDSLKKAGINIEYFTIIGKGFVRYAINILIFRKYLKKNNVDLVHSHYFLSSLVATFSIPKKIVVSLMGSDVYTSKLWNIMIRLLSKVWNATIVKSECMKDVLYLDYFYVIPNGVNIKMYYPINKNKARKILGLSLNKYILFASNADRKEKNYKLAKNAFDILNMDCIELIQLKDIQPERVVYYLNAVNVVLMTSKYEGSPNIIKEAMACNRPIVSTDVGDVGWVMGNIKGCYITTEDPVDVSNKLRSALNYSEKYECTDGRQRIIQLGLESNIIANKIIDIYKNVTEK